ncbi:MAG: LysM peptidoglycan-binding domain-containing protein [Alicyclobacillus sp.]|nr:LysM peptidoglycan-binding domain-containing protein [Alicyclobacillus sp.]
MQIHVVQRGENLYTIAQRYGVRVAQIVAANGLPNPNQLLVGQALVIPSNVYVVRPGDTVWSIAQRFGTTPQALLQLNRLPATGILYAGQALRLPEPPKPAIDVNAFTVQFGQSGAQAVREVGPYLTYVSPFAYRIQATGGLEPVDDAATLQAAQQNRIVPMMAITNFTATEAGTALASAVLNDVSVQETLLTNVVNTMREKGYRGLNIDFENVSPSDKEAYNAFLQRAVDRLHPEGYFVSSSLAPKTSANQPGLLYEAHDYPAHGRILDFVVLMTYEWGYRLGPPQAISPIDQIARVLEYAVTAIPRNKIFMGFQVYARDWLLPHVQGQQAETFSMSEALRRAIQYGAVIQYDTTAQSPYYRYTDAQGRQHEVWFEDARSAQAKFDLVKRYNLRGISYWVLGYPFPENWPLLAANFTIRKRA